ncbi:hypothetical protein GCM10009624_35060 [Gordonia sinesedis]
MCTGGVDLSASPASTAVAVVEWASGAARVTDLVAPADDATIRRIVAGTDRCGIDSPFGWPDAFVEFVTAHHRGHQAAGADLDRIANRRPLAYRRTDRYLVDAGLGRPLSVSADQIAHVAFRCAGLLADLGVSDRVDGWAVEAYPAGALRQWGLRSRGYKRSAHRDVLHDLVADLQCAAPWLDLGAHAEAMASDDNAFDAVVTALVARAAALRYTTLPADADRAVAAREGWIHVPRCALDDLVG